MSKYSKFVTAVIGVGVLVLDHFLGTGNFVDQVVIASATALGVYGVPNKTGN
jgi:hypothetical protein